MLSLEKIVAGAKLRGLAGSAVVEVVRVEWIGSDALNVVYRSAVGPGEVLLYRDAEPRLELAEVSRAFSFDGDGETFRIGVCKITSLHTELRLGVIVRRHLLRI